MSQPSIAIIGGGPCGLAFARLLEVNDISYIVYERDQSAKWAEGRYGTGTLDLHPQSGQMALKAAGLFEHFQELSRSDGSNIIANSQGDIVLDMGNRAESDRPEIDRKDLRRILLESVPKDKIQWGSKIESVQKDSKDGAISIHFTDGKITSGFRLVVGADGAWSKTRSVVTTATPRYSGAHFLCSKLTPDSPAYAAVEGMAGNGNYMAIGSRRMIGAQRLGDNSYYTLVGLNLPETWSRDEKAGLLTNPDALRKWLVQEVLTGWPKLLTDIVEHSSGAIYDWPLWEMPPESLSWESVPGVTLIGDAAHVTTPFLGEGVNCAMHDSYELATNIVKHGLDNINDAVKEYEQSMFPRGVKLISGSAKNGELMIRSDDAPYNWMRMMAEQMKDAGITQMHSLFLEAANRDPTKA